MGNGTRQEDFWTTQEVYAYLFDQLAPPATLATLETPQRLLSFFGFISEAGVVTQEPWETFEAATAIADTTGPYMIRAIDANDNPLATTRLDLQYWVTNTPPTPATHIDPAPFEGVIRFPAETTRFQIISGTQVLLDVPVSAHAPTVSNVTPATSGSFNGPYTITWTGHDADGDALSYKVEYNPDVTNAQSAWEVLMDGLTETQWAEDFRELPGGNHARIRVTVSDGVLSGNAESAEFTVPFKPPEVFIQELDWGYDYEEGDEVQLAVEAVDLQDNVIAEAQIQWSSSLSGTLGTGATLIVDNLPVGEHVITARVTNSAGLSASDRVTITIGSVSNEYIEYVAGSNRVVRLTNNYNGLATTVDIPVRATYTDTFVTYQYLKDPPGSGVPGAYLAGRNFSLGASVSQGEDWIPVVFSSTVPMTVTLAYPALPPNVPVSSLRLYRWDGIRWIDAATECSPASSYDRSVAGRISLPICHFGDFALRGALGAPPRYLYLPLTMRQFP